MADPRRLVAKLPSIRTVAWTALVGVLAVYSLSVIWTNVLPTRNTLAATEQRLRELERENLAHETMLRRTELECEMLERDPWTVERILRDEYRMSRPGEIVIR